MPSKLVKPPGQQSTTSGDANTTLVAAENMAIKKRRRTASRPIKYPTLRSVVKRVMRDMAPVLFMADTANGCFGAMIDDRITQFFDKLNELISVGVQHAARITVDQVDRAKDTLKLGEVDDSAWVRITKETVQSRVHGGTVTAPIFKKIKRIIAGIYIDVAQFIFSTYTGPAQPRTKKSTKPIKRLTESGISDILYTHSPYGTCGSSVDTPIGRINAIVFKDMKVVPPTCSEFLYYNGKP